MNETFIAAVALVVARAFVSASPDERSDDYCRSTFTRDTPGDESNPIVRRPRRVTRPPEHEIRDAALVARLRAHDSDALASIIALYDEELRRFAYLTVHDPEIAADVVQDIFVSLWRRRETVSIPGTVADYLYRAVRNRALDALKHEAAETRLKSAVSQQFEIHMSNVSNAADAGIVTQEFADAVAAAIRTLTPRVRDTFLMHRVHGMTYTEIASALDVSVVTVQSQISRAVKQLLEYLAPFR